MLKSLLLKTLFTKRWMILTWTLGIFGLVVFTMIFYPTLSKSFGESLKDIPDSLKAFIGDASAYTTIAGYTDLQVFSQLTFMTIILAVILGSALVAGEEGDGTLQTLLVQPITRGKVYLGKLKALVVLIAVACLGILIGVVVGALIIGERIGLERLLLATLAAGLLSSVFGILSFSLGAITGRRGLSGGFAGATAFTSLLISSLAESVQALRIVDNLSPFHYFNKPGILQYGAQWSDLTVLALICLVLSLAGYMIFARRDVYQR